MTKPKAGFLTSEFWLNISTIAAILMVSLSDMVDRGLIPLESPSYRILIYALTAITAVYTVSRGAVKAFGGSTEKIDRVYTAPVLEVNTEPATKDVEPVVAPTVVAPAQAISDDQLASREVFDHTQAA